MDLNLEKVTLFSNSGFLPGIHCTVDQEIFAIQIFSLVAEAAKIKHAEYFTCMVEWSGQRNLNYTKILTNFAIYGIIVKLLRYTFDAIFSFSSL